MQTTAAKHFRGSHVRTRKAGRSVCPNLTDARRNKPCVVKSVLAKERELRDFLFSLGVFEGEVITVAAVLGDNYVIDVKQARYCIDADLAGLILIEAA